jgi:chorismate mutase
MRWRLIRRRLSISAPTMAVRSHLPWPLRWVVAALMLGFSASLGLWAFEFGRDVAGLKHEGGESRQVLEQVRQQLEEARHDRDAAQAVSNSADSLLKAERVTQQRLAEQVKALEAENLALKDDLGFFERLLPAAGDGLSVRGLQVDASGAGQLRFQLLVMQQGGRTQPEFKGKVELLLSGLREGKTWVDTAAAFQQPLVFKQYRRVDGLLTVPANVVVKQVQVRVVEDGGMLKANQVLKL